MENKIVERQKITINKVTYFLDSLDEESQKLLQEIRIIDGEIQHLNTQMSIAGVAKNSLLEKIDESADKFETAPEEEKDEEEKKVKEEPAYINQ